jgi:hypothetical protein
LVGAGSHPAETPGGAVFGGETRSFKGLLPGQGLEVQERELWARDPSADKKRSCMFLEQLFLNLNGFENFEISKAQQHAQENTCM